MSDNYGRMIQALRDSAADMKAADENLTLTKARHKQETEDAHEQINRAMRRAFILQEMMKLVIQEGMTVEQAKMIAHEALGPEDQVMFSQGSVLVARKRV